MKVLIIIEKLTASIAVLKSDRVQDPSHNLFWFSFRCQVCQGTVNCRIIINISLSSYIFSKILELRLNLIQ